MLIIIRMTFFYSVMAYMKKAISIADVFSTQHEEEFNLRTNFHAKLKKHFLSKMFPGMEDLPPAFATERPENFYEHSHTPSQFLMRINFYCRLYSTHKDE